MKNRIWFMGAEKKMKINFKNIFVVLSSPAEVLNYGAAYFNYKRGLSQIMGCTIEEIDRLYQEINGSDFIRNIIIKSNSPISFFHPNMLSPFRAPAIYVICRILKPETVVETGVADGFSSSFILQALELNQKGRLFSIDLPNQPGHEIENETGWLIPKNLRYRWRLILGSSEEKLPTLLTDLKRVDLFYHDSEHIYENMMFEFNAVWKYLKPKGRLLADDITDNTAFREFVEEKRCRYIKLFKLGIAIK